jgi:signal transduction histidine kinase
MLFSLSKLKTNRNLSQRFILPNLFSKKDILIKSVSLIVFLLIVNVTFLYFNSQMLKENQVLKEQAERVNYNLGLIFDEVVRGYDIGVCQYALTLQEKYFTTFEFAYQSKDSIFDKLKEDLVQQKYNNLPDIAGLEDSVEVFAQVCRKLYGYAKSKKESDFQNLFSKDYGYNLYKYFTSVRNKVNQFENAIILGAQKKYEKALYLNYFVQFVIVIIAFLTLFFTIIFTRKAALLNDKVISMEKEQSRILKEQNHHLEGMVLERTEEIRKQNQELLRKQDEISQQKELLEIQHADLHQSHLIIETQNQEIQLKNEKLESQVALRTEQLVTANNELIAHNNQLEQFAYVTAHNLRAPVARVLGLTSLLEIGENHSEEREFVFNQVIASVKQLDIVIKDLNLILEMRKNNAIVYTTLHLRESLEKVEKILENEIIQTDAQIEADFTRVPAIISFTPYLESIIYNLLSNAIKYRHPARKPVIQIFTSRTSEGDIVLTVQDNGLGIDLKANSNKLFSLYKRFHNHTEGKGLGLYLVKTQVENLDGKIEVISEPGDGSSFIITFKTSKYPYS